MTDSREAQPSVFSQHPDAVAVSVGSRIQMASNMKVEQSGIDVLVAWILADIRDDNILIHDIAYLSLRACRMA